MQKSDDLNMLTVEFIRHLKRINYSDETISGYSKDLKKFNIFLKAFKIERLVEEISKNDLLDYMNYLKEDQCYKVNSISRSLSTLKSFFNFLVQELDFNNNPAMKIKGPKSYTPLPQVLDFDEIKALLDAARAHSFFYHVLLSFIYYTGTRITPARTMLKENIDLKNGRAYFPYIKGGRDLHIPLHPNVISILKEFLDLNRDNESVYVFQSPKLLNTPISPADVRNNLKKIAKVAHITKRVNPHLLRHSVATHLTLLNVEQAYIASILGHVDLRSTRRYQHLHVENLRSAVERLY